MICLISLVVFAFMGIFSVKYRKLAAKAFDCVFRRLTLRPCQSGLDQQVRSSIISFFSKRDIRAAKFVVKYFEIISWFFTILMILSMFFAARGVYYYVVYGNCNGAGSDEFCVFDKLNPTQASTCHDPSIISENQTFIKPTIDDDPSRGPNDAKVVIIEFGCFDCPYTKKAYPITNEIMKNYNDKVLFVYRDFPLPIHNNSEIKPMAAECADEQGKFWEFHDNLFEKEKLENTNSGMIELASELGLNIEDFTSCLESEKYLSEIKKDFEDGRNAGVYGTPTFFINDEVVIGPKPYQYFKNVIESELRK
ncbi:MAG: thioredoxin domain-containing protein [archaeon]